MHAPLKTARLLARPVVSMLAALVMLVVLALARAATVAAIPPAAPAPEDRPYPGVITLNVDATDVQHRVMQIDERMPVRPGALTLFYPKWLPGNHAPTGPIEALVGLQVNAITAGGASQRLEWQRDTLDVYAFHLEIPDGSTELHLLFQFATPFGAEQGRRVMTPEMLQLQWEKALLYPAGHYVKRITMQPSVKLPAGWAFASALELAQRDTDTLVFRPTSLEMLVDSPLFAGRNSRRVELDADAAAPVYLNVFADRDSQLQMTPAQLEAHRRLVREARASFGARHFVHYDFLLALSDDASGVGLEHHQSSENGLDSRYFLDWDSVPGPRDLLAHELVHSWNGKFRRPADLWTPNYNVPMQDSLLWVYEGMTEFWGMVLAARSGLWSPEFTRDAIAWTAATYGELRKGRAWRALQDTTNQPILGYRKPTAYPSWQRGTDYYQEGMLLWLDMDMRLRELTSDKRSLDDFARRFLGIGDGDLGPVNFNYDDVVATLNAVAAADWNHVLRQHLDGHDTATTLAAFDRSGWQLRFSEQTTAYVRSLEKSAKVQSLTFSLGLTIRKDGGRIGDVIWDSPAYRAGLTPAMNLVAVNGRAYSDDLLKEAITQAKTRPEPIELIVRADDEFRVMKLDYHDGLRYPHLERMAALPDRIGALLKPRSRS